MRRLAALTLALVVPVAMVTLPSPASAASTPKVTKFSATAGPLNKTVKVTLSGSNLHKASKARVGRASARISSKKSRSLVLTVPRSSRATTAKVQLYSARKWRTVGTWRYVARPSITTLSRTQAPVEGGATLTVTGKNLAISPRLTFGGKAVRITRSVTNRTTKVVTLTATTPTALPGKVKLSVTTPGGVTSRDFTFTLPQAVDTSAYAPASETFVPSSVQWVQKVEPEADEDGNLPEVADGEPLPEDARQPTWIVSITQGASIPEVGTPFFLAPGSDVYPTGLSGTVTSVAQQIDGSVRLTIEAAPFSDALTTADVDFADGPPPATVASSSKRTADVDLEASKSVSFQKFTPSALKCIDKDGRQVSVTGELGLRLEDVNRKLDFTAGLHPKIDAWYTSTVVAYGTIKVEGSVTCSLKREFTIANKKIVPVGTTGATFSFAPSLDLTVSGAGSINFEQRTQTMFGAAKNGVDGPVKKYNEVRSVKKTVTGAGTVQVDVAAGVSVQVAVLDIAGVEIKAQGFVRGKATASGLPLKVCFDVEYGLRGSIGLFFDVWVVRWESLKLSVSWTLPPKLSGCTAPGQPVPPATAPEITSSTLPTATAGTPYSTTLGTADGRVGTWSVSGGSLPPGLTLSDTGTISGTPTEAGIGTRPVTIRFQDTSLRLAEASLRLQVKAPVGLGGGDIQATLTWNHAADMDLHALEPDGTEIYFGNSTSPTGGELDHDSNVGCGDDSLVAENIRWPADAAPSGTYYFAVQTYRACDVVDPTWHLVVRVDGQIVLDQTGSGTSDWIELSYGPAARSVSPVQKALPPMSVPHKD